MSLDETPPPFPDRHHVNAAEGWLDLGMADEAERELDQIPPVGAGHPMVLDLRWRICGARGQWEEAEQVAARMVVLAPDSPAGWIHRSFALHELRRTGEARAHLLKAAVLFPAHPILAYNLACYACAMGDLEDARDWLRRAAELKGKDEIRAMAADDPDLAALRDEISDW